MSRIIAIIHGRMSSSRLPGKVMKDLAGKSVFYHHFERLSQCKKIEKIYLATSKNENNEPLLKEAIRYDIPYYAGAEEDVLERYITIMNREKASVVVRCGCDKPLLSYEIINDLLDKYEDEDLLCVTTVLPRGIGSEVLSLHALERIHQHYRGPAISRYVTEYPYLFKTRGIEVDDEFSRPEFRLTLDTEEDYELIKTIYQRFYKDGHPVNLREGFKYLDDHPEISNINRFVRESQINAYLRELSDKPVFSIYKNRDNKYVIKNRIGEIISSAEFKKAVDDSWAE